MDLNIKKKYSVVDIMLLLTLVMLFAMRNISIISVYGWLIPAALVLVGYIQSQGWVIRKNALAFIVPYLVFLIFCFVSYLWAADKSIVISKCYALLRIYGGAFLFSLIILKLEDIEKLLHLFYITGVITLAHLFLKTPLSIWKDCLYGEYDASSSAGRLGNTIGYQPNELGQFCAVIMMLSVFYYNKTHKKRYLVIGAVDIVVLFFTKSRSSILMLIAGVSLYLLTSERKIKKKIILIVSIAAAALAAYWLIFNVPVLYRLVGFRFEGILAGEGNQDASTDARKEFFRYAIKLFKEHPILGVGIDNFKFYSMTFNDAWAEVSSHSNWGEMLSCTGIIGTSLFYVPQIASVVILFRSLKELDGNRRRLCAILFTILFINVTFDFVKTSYDKSLTLYMACFAVVGAVMIKNSISNVPSGDKENDKSIINQQIRS
ncbi:MAG: O-antigen ligase family protein [Clostridia bacterium]|nr:O-antigen ligase family protein [Clostridia bacterium]